MGLDCTAYKNIRQMSKEEVTYDEYEDENGQVVDRYPNNGISFYVNPGFSEVAKEIQPQAIYDFEEKFSWRAGSYSGIILGVIGLLNLQVGKMTKMLGIMVKMDNHFLN